jgi:hypothetical protein
MGRAVGFCQEMFVDETGVGLAVYRRQMGVEKEIAAYFSRLELSEILEEKPVDRKFCFEDLRIGE